VVSDSEGNLRISTVTRQVAPSTSNNKGLQPVHNGDCKQKKKEMLDREAQIKKRLEACDMFWSKRRKSIESELERIQQELNELSLLQDWQPMSLEIEETEPGTGHSAVPWFESQTFIIICILIILVDLGVIVIALGWPCSAIHK